VNVHFTDEYLKARQKANDAIDNTDVCTEVEDIQPERQLRKRKGARMRILSDEDNSSNSSSEETLPNHREPPKKSGKNTCTLVQPPRLSLEGIIWPVPHTSTTTGT
jgi:hypothetical protein